MASAPAATPISTLFLDIGGVLLTNGWDHHARHRAARNFDLDEDEMNERHHLTFDTYEEGKLSLDQYLNRVVFYRQRSFSPDDFKRFMYDQSQAHEDTIALMRSLKEKHHLRVGAISNEGLELTVYRIETFKLKEFIDFFISSCFVHYRKPDEDMYRMALNVGQVKPDEAVYIDDRPMFVEVARSMGLRGIHHKDHDSTRRSLQDLGLSV